MGNYLLDLKKSFKSGKMGQAKTLLAKLSSKHIQEKLEVLELLALTPDKTALQALSFLTSKKYKDPDIHDRLIQLITDRAHLNFNFVLILMENADKKIIAQSIPLIRHILSNETDKDLLNEIIRTSGMRQIEILTDDIAEFIFYDDRVLKAESIKALERIGTEAARDDLIKASQTEKCDQDILDAIQILSSKKVEINEEIQSEVPTPAPPKSKMLKLDQLISNDFQNRFDALSALSLETPKVIAKLLRQTDNNNIDLTINLLKVVKRTIPFSATLRIFDILNQKTTDNLIKFAAYSALESYPELKSAASVVQGLSESSFFVRIAAIRVLNKNLSDFVFAEIKNKIESGTKKGETLAQNILDASAENIIEQLMISDTFSYMASNYLSGSAPIQSLDLFISILEKRNLKSTAQKYHTIRKQRAAEKKKLLILISSCDAILNIYNKLICSCGYKTHMFESPQDAFETILSEKPDAIVCDLFLTDITAIEFASEIRELYTIDEVPIIISTTQKGFDKSKLEKEMTRVGVNALCDFPAKTSQIKSWVK